MAEQFLDRQMGRFISIKQNRKGDMEKINVMNERFTIACSHDELIIINNVLNEIIHGIDLPDFEARVGFSKTKAAALLNEIGSFIE